MPVTSVILVRTELDNGDTSQVCQSSVGPFGTVSSADVKIFSRRLDEAYLCVTEVTLNADGTLVIYAHRKISVMVGIMMIEYLLGIVTDRLGRRLR